MLAIYYIHLICNQICLFLKPANNGVETSSTYPSSRIWVLTENQVHMFFVFLFTGS